METEGKSCSICQSTDSREGMRQCKQCGIRAHPGCLPIGKKAPYKCMDCLQQLVLKEKAPQIPFPSAKDVAKLSEDPRFFKAIANVPIIDQIEFRAMMKRNGLKLQVRGSEKLTVVQEGIYLRTFLASMRWLDARCDNFGCLTPNGKPKFDVCEQCGKKVCGIKCNQNHRCEDEAQNEVGCCGDGCEAEEERVFTCEKCCLVFYCSEDCRQYCALNHSMRCCRERDAVSDNGPLALVYVTDSSSRTPLVEAWQP